MEYVKKKADSGEIFLRGNTFRSVRMGKYQEDRWKANEAETNGPNGTRTRVFGVRGQCPRPLDDGTNTHKRIMFTLIFSLEICQGIFQGKNIGPRMTRMTRISLVVSIRVIRGQN